MEQLDPTRDKKLKAKKQAQALMTKLKIKSQVQVFIYTEILFTHMINLKYFYIQFTDYELSIGN